MDKFPKLNYRPKKAPPFIVRYYDSSSNKRTSPNPLFHFLHRLLESANTWIIKIIISGKFESVQTIW